MTGGHAYAKGPDGQRSGTETTGVGTHTIVTERKRKTMKSKIGTLILLLSVACGGEEAETEATNTETPAEETAEAPAEAPAEEAAEAPAEAPAAPEGLGELAAALNQAVEAAQNAEGGTPCEQGYSTIAGMMTQFGQTPPERDAFISGCNELPEPAQRCMSMNYAMEHQEECNGLRDDPAVVAFKESMGMN